MLLFLIKGPVWIARGQPLLGYCQNGFVVVATVIHADGADAAVVKVPVALVTCVGDVVFLAPPIQATIAGVLFWALFLWRRKQVTQQVV